MAFVVSTPGNAPTEVGVPGNNKYIIKTCTFSGTYSDAANVLSATTLGLEQVHLVLCSTDNSGFVPVYDYTDGQLHLYYADNDASADGALIIAAGTVVAVVRVIAFGR